MQLSGLKKYTDCTKLQILILYLHQTPFSETGEGGYNIYCCVSVILSNLSFPAPQPPTIYFKSPVKPMIEVFMQFNLFIYQSPNATLRLCSK